MTPSRRRLLLAAASAGLAGAGIASRAQEPGPAGVARAPLPKLGTPLALPEVAIFDGTRFRAQPGEVVVVYWWASWCPFCAVQSPSMQKLWDTERARGLRFLGLAIDKRVEDAQAYLKKRGYTFPSGWFTPEVARVLPQPKGLPVTLVRGRDGRVALAEAGQLFPEDIAEIGRFL